MKIVVSRYNEDIKWTYQFPNVIIYNKGPPLSDLNVIPLENVGREGHTYYQYIVDHYDDLDNFTVFLQGNPFDHSPNIIQTLWDYFYERKVCSEFDFLSECIYRTSIFRCPYWKKIPMKRVYDRIFHKVRPPKIENKQGWFSFGCGAQFIVSRERIRCRPREFYLNIIKLLEYNSDPIEGHAIERYHTLIFAKK